MTKVPSSAKTLTIIGLVIEGLSLLFLGGVTLLISSVPDLIEETVYLLVENVMEFNYWMDLIPFFRGLLIVILVIMILAFVVNLFLFIPSISEKKSKNFTSNVFLYQAILGGFYLLSNQLLGIIYLIAGIIGRNQLEKDIENVRDGI